MLTPSNKDFLRKKFAEQLCGGSNLRTIALVGAFRSAKNKSGLSTPDENFLSRALKILNAQGYPAHSSFDLDIININKEMGGKDYLDPRVEFNADISIFCYIRKMFPFHLRITNPREAGTKFSPYELGGGNHAWCDSANRHGSSVLITFGGEMKENGLSVNAREVIGIDFEKAPGRKRPFEKIASEVLLPMQGDIRHVKMMPGVTYELNTELLVQPDIMN